MIFVVAAVAKGRQIFCCVSVNFKSSLCHLVMWNGSIGFCRQFACLPFGYWITVCLHENWKRRTEVLIY